MAMEPDPDYDRYPDGTSPYGRKDMPTHLCPTTVNKLTARFQVKLLGIKVFQDEERDSVACMVATSTWRIARPTGKRRVILTVSPHGLEVADPGDESMELRPFLFHTLDEITHIYKASFANRVFAYTARPKSDALTARFLRKMAPVHMVCIGLKVKRFSTTRLSDIHHAYEVAREYAHPSPKADRLLSSQELQRQPTYGSPAQTDPRMTTSPLQCQTSEGAAVSGMGATSREQRPSRSLVETAGATKCSCRQASSGGGGGSSVPTPHCSHSQCTKCASYAYCRHCPCTTCRRRRHRHRARLEAEAITNPRHGYFWENSTQHHAPLGPDGPDDDLPGRRTASHAHGTEAQSSSKTEPSVDPRRQAAGRRRRASSTGEMGESVRTRTRQAPGRDEIHQMAKSIALAVLRDRERREQVGRGGLPRLDQRAHAGSQN